MYRGIGPEAGTVVTKDQAFDYAIERCLNGTEEEKEEFVDWYYTGNWIEEEDD